MARNVKATKEYRDLKRSLEDNLAARGMVEPVYRDKVQEYLDLWILKRQLQDDVAERGLTVVDDRGRETENRSISLGIQVSRQMLTIYNALGFQSKGGAGTGFPDDEL